MFEKPKQEIHIRSYVVNEEYAKINAIVNKVYRNWKEAQSSPLADGFIESADREIPAARTKRHIHQTIPVASTGGHDIPV